MKNFTLVLICCITINVFAQEPELESVYRRSSLYTLMVTDENREFANNIEESFVSSPIPEKFNDHIVTNRTIPKVLDNSLSKKEMKIAQQEAISEYLNTNQIAKAMETHLTVTGALPVGWYTGRDSPNTRSLVLEHENILYDSDSYADDLPYWVKGPKAPHLVIPYTLDTNDMRFATAQGFNSGEQFFQYIKDAFDILYEEGEKTPKLLNIGLHCRIIGRPARFKALKKFVSYIKSKSNVWICKREDIAYHWHENHQP